MKSGNAEVKYSACRSGVPPTSAGAAGLLFLAQPRNNTAAINATIIIAK
jgi:hypothetical protein